MLKTSESTEFKIRPVEGGVGVGGSSRVRHDKSRSKLDESKMSDNEFDGGEVDDEVEKKDQKTSISKNTIRSSDFLTLGAKLAFT